MNAVDQFLGSASFAVVGASRDRAKYGNLVFRRLLDSGRTVYPLNPTADLVEGRPAYPSQQALLQVPEAVSFVAPPAVTERLIPEAIRLGVKHVWMQPGAVHPAASQLARAAGLNVIDDGSCILVALALE
jgi:predicted CoA-binding protein